MPRLYRSFPKVAGSSFEGIPTLAEWQELTTVTRLNIRQSRSNPRLLKIDAGLAEYERSEAVDLAGNPDARAPEAYAKITFLQLCYIGARAADWIVARSAQRFRNWRSLRKRHIERLLEQVLRVLNDPGFAGVGRTIPAPGTDAASAQSALTSAAAQLRWQMALEAIKGLQGAHAEGKTLEGHYWLETNIAGGNPAHRQGGAVADDWADSEHKYAFNFLQSFTRGSEVHYVAAEDRWRYKIEFRPDPAAEGAVRAFRRTAETGDSFTPAFAEGTILVVDSQGQFYSTFGDPAPEGKVFHHSSILAGTAVEFAGGIVIRDGIVCEIDNMSGHYRPGKTHLIKALQHLGNRHGYDLENVALLLQQAAGEDDMPNIKTIHCAKTALEDGSLASA
ncbi:MAG: hypothetical protein VYC39_10055 [Myxococcota bacterium]|nr:hypothetical protein [Myxococcota bacterium]